MRESAVEFCPVPTEQRPINEYEELKDSWFFRWATLAELSYWRKLGWVWLGGWLIAGPIAAASFVPSKYPLQFTLCGSAAAGFFVVLVLLRLYLGWCYVSDRLSQSKISYEESGWYDGQIWQKPDSMLARDRLVVTYEVKPILNRLKRTALILAAIVAFGTLIWLLL